MSSPILDLHDKPVVNQPGQQSTSGLLVQHYKAGLALAYEQLDSLPGLHQTEQISLETYAEADKVLCDLIDTYRALLALLGHRQPQRSR